MKKALFFLISLIIGIVIFVWVFKFIGWQDIKNALSLFRGWYGLVILGLTILMVLVGTWKWKTILAGTGVNIPFRAILSSYLAGFSTMFLFPILIWGGEIFRGYALKDKNGVPWQKAMASIIIDRIFEWTTNLVVIFLGTLFFFSKITLLPLKLEIVFGVAFLAFLLGISFFYFKCIKKESIVRFFVRHDTNQPLETEKEIFNFFKLKKTALWEGLFLSFLRAAIMYSRVWFLILFLGKNIGILSALSILGFTYLAAMIPIPTSLGSHEAIQTFAFNSLGLGASTAAAFTMIIRTAELVVALIGVLFFFRLGLGILKNLLFQRINGFAKKIN